MTERIAGSAAARANHQGFLSLTGLMNQPLSLRVGCIDKTGDSERKGERLCFWVGVTLQQHSIGYTAQKTKDKWLYKYKITVRIV